MILAACGLFQAYLAVFDPTLFNLVSMGDLTNRLVVSAATVVAAGVPFLFGLGALKEGVVPNLQTVFFYERMLRGKSFWLVSALFTLSLAPAIYIQGRLQQSEGLAVGGITLLVSLYLLLIAKRQTKFL